MSKLLFYGELFPKSVNGIAIANLTNLSLLKKKFTIDIVEEEVNFKEHNKISFNKFCNALKQMNLIISKSCFNRYSFFYLVFSLSTFGAFKTFMSILSFRLFNKGKVVLHIHRGDFFSRFHKGFINKIFTWFIFKMTHKIIVLSEKPKLEIDKTFNKSCEVLFNTVDVEYEIDFKEKKNIVFLYISNYLIDKGILDLLEVFTSLCSSYPNITLETFGAFSDQDLKKSILSFNSSNIHINDTITGIEKFKKIADADCLILPSWNEGQPIVLLEAISVGTPVISTNVGLIPDLLGIDYPYLANACDHKSLKQTIIDFIESDNNNLAKELKEKYYKLYCKKKHEENLLKIFSHK
jgi:glycosyltransferase involved in cell wall biosynthesis